MDGVADNDGLPETAAKYEHGSLLAGKTPRGLAADDGPSMSKTCAERRICGPTGWTPQEPPIFRCRRVATCPDCDARAVVGRSRVSEFAHARGFFAQIKERLNWGGCTKPRKKRDVRTRRAPPSITVPRHIAC